MTEGVFPPRPDREASKLKQRVYDLERKLGQRAQPSTGVAGTARPYATYVVAAFDSIATDAANADRVCFGSNDQVFINELVTLVGAAGGGRVLLLEGHYGLSGSISITDDNVVLEGQGPGTIISAPSVTGIGVSGVDDVAIRNINFLEASMGVSLQNTENLHIDHCTFRGTFTTDCVKMITGNTNVIITECDFEDCSGFGVNASVVNTLRVENCNFRDCGNAGALAAGSRGGINLGAVYFAVTDCQFYASGQRHILGTATHGVIANNVFIQEENPAAAGTTAGIEGAGFTYVNISDNYFEPRGSSTSACVRLGSSDQRVTVSDNIFRGGAGTGIDVAGTATDITLQGNYVYGHNIGVSIGGSVVRLLLDGNTLRSNTTNISGTPSSTGAGNYIDGVWTPAISGGSGKGPAYYTVASTGAPADIIARADFVCDGTGDQVEINNAIAALPTDGGIIWLSSGVFNITGAITVTNRPGVVIVGQGGSGYVGPANTTSPTQIRRSAGAAVAIVSTSNSPGFVLRGIRFNLASGQTASTLMLNLGGSSLIDDCYIDGVNNAFSNAQQGVGWLNASGTIRNSRLLCTDSCVRIRGTTSGLDGLDTLVENCIMRSTDNTTRGCIEIDGLIGGMPDPTTSAKVRIVRVRHDGSGAWRFINAKEMSRLDIVDCQLFDFEEAAMNLLNCSDVRIAGNNLRGLTSGNEPAINIDGCTFVKINDNRVDYCGEEAILVNDSDDCSVIDNDIIGAGQSTDNTFDAIMLNGNTNRCLVDGNLVRFAGANHSRYALRIDDSTCDDNAVGVNDFLNGGDSGEISDLGTATRYLATSSAAAFDFAAMEAFGG